MTKKKREEPLPPNARRFSQRTGHVICKCKCGYGSVFDGLCIKCRGGMTAWEAKQGGSNG